MTIRSPVVAGSFYPGNKQGLTQSLEEMLGAEVGNSQKPKGLIVPHAGYHYSGEVAAATYCRIRPFAKDISKVILIGPSHRYYLQSAAVTAHTLFATPLGTIVINAELKEQARRHPDIIISDHAHRREHSIEVQLPFLQMCLSEFSLLPIVVGEMSANKLCSIIESFQIDEQTLLVISTDLSHFHPYDEAKTLDANTIKRILARDHHISPEQACGAHGLNGSLLYCARHDWQPNLISCCNSGDVSHDHSRVVGYASFTLH